MRGSGGIWNDAAGGYQFDGQTGELYRYGYDLSNRLVSVEKSKAGSAALTMVARYTYDIRDLRIKTVKPGATTYTQYDPSGDIVWSEKGGETVTYVQALGQTWAEIRTDSTGSKTFWHHTDHEGTTEAVTDSAGAVVWDASYGGYGDILRSNGTLDFTPSYTGKELDSDSGLYYFNARWYDPELGRFITEDPARDGENWFAYCNENPLRYTDPTGLDQQYWNLNGKLDHTVQSKDTNAVFLIHPEGDPVQLNDNKGNPFSIEGFHELTGTLYNEMDAEQQNPTEAAGIYSVLENRGSVTGKDTLTEAREGKIYGNTDKYGNKVWTNIDKKGVDQDRLAAATQGLIMGIMNPDYSKGAYFWDGADIQTNDHFKTWGIHYTDSAHDIYHTNDNLYQNPIVQHWINNGKETTIRGSYDHKLDSTTAIGGTIFWKYSPGYRKAEEPKAYRR